MYSREGVEHPPSQIGLNKINFVASVAYSLKYIVFALNLISEPEKVARSTNSTNVTKCIKQARRRPLYLLSGSLVCLATASLSAYNWIAPSLDPSIKESIIFLPLVSVILMYTGFGLGYGPIVVMLQGKV